MLVGFLPPAALFEGLTYILGKAVTDNLGWYATYNGIGGYVLRDNGSAGQDGSVAYAYSCGDGHAVSDPYVVSDVGLGVWGEWMTGKADGAAAV